MCIVYQMNLVLTQSQFISVNLAKSMSETNSSDIGRIDI